MSESTRDAMQKNDVKNCRQVALTSTFGWVIQDQNREVEIRLVEENQTEIQSSPELRPNTLKSRLLLIEQFHFQPIK